ncbi:MAG: SUMF1/EgtB/PvdO family nonheme iron enzyme [Alphaproteobacteria bacterium]|nr:SUMF1/EgtB/PvdO family nonheme iron enzyme [Alphaproteobacteria bacterium]
MAKPPQKQGRAYYYRMRTPEKRLEKNVKFAAIAAVLLVVLLAAAFGAAQIFDRPAPETEEQTAIPVAPPEADTPAEPAEEFAPAVIEKPEAAASGARMLRDCADCPPLVVVPAGSFAMGIQPAEDASGKVAPSMAASERPLHGVTFRKPFALEQTEVTRQQFDAFVRDTQYQATGCEVFDGNTWVLDRSKSWRDPGFYQDKDHPVVCVNRADAQAYIAWLSKKAGVKYRLPTESEWEYAARAGTSGAYVWGNDLTQACFDANVAGSTHMNRYKGRPTSLVFACDSHHAETAPVGKYRANAFGLYDMFGNVREIVADCWNPDHRNATADGAAVTTGDCDATVARGGGWADPPANLRSARRMRAAADERRGDQGFRIARDLSDEEIP